jgi:ABC-type branched-subunit amino acid transport system ATPase component
MIRVENLVKTYGTFKAVADVSLDVPPGEIHGFLGPNGAGKTTTISMIAVVRASGTTRSIRVANLSTHRPPAGSSSGAVVRVAATPARVAMASAFNSGAGATSIADRGTEKALDRPEHRG